MDLMEKYLARARARKEAAKKKPERPFRPAIKLYFPLIGGHYWLLRDAENRPREDPVFTDQEIVELRSKKRTPEELRAVHEVKKAFREAEIVPDLPDP